MSFNKRYISKELILSKKDIESVYKLFKSDAAILDNWSSQFYGHLYPDLKRWDHIRVKEIQNQQLCSNPQKPDSINNFYLSNILFDLKTNPNWIDILMTLDQLQININSEISGDFEKMIQFCVTEIINYYESSKELLSNIRS
jgi:hypothetical protein